MTYQRERNPQFSFGGDEPPRRPFPWAVVLVVLAVLAVGSVAAYVYFYQPQTVRALLGDTPLAPPTAETRLYRWRADDGTLNITDRPPPAGVEYEVITVRGDTNIVPATPAE